MKKYTKYFLFALAFIFAGALQLGGETSALVKDKNIRELETGDTIYFDNSGTKWKEVKIYFFKQGGNKSNEPFSWDSSPTMTQIGETNVYEYKITKELDIKKYHASHIVFLNGSGEQTIDLAFIETGYAYLADSEEGNKKKGYWYVYDKIELVDTIRSAKEYEAYSDYLKKASNDDLVALIRNREGIVNGEIKVEAKSNNSGYYIEFGISTEDLEKAPVDPDAPTETPVDPDAPTETPVDPDVPTETPVDPDVPTETPVDPDVPTETPVDPDVPTETPANPSTFDNIAVAVSGLGIASLAGFVLYNKVKQRR